MEIIYLASVQRFIDKLDEDTTSKFKRTKELLEKQGYKTGIPLSKSLGEGLFELRVLGKNSIRLFYCFHNNSIFIIHAFFKKSQKLPKQELEYARGLKNVLVSR